MAKIINNFFSSYDYDELIADLQEDLLYGACIKELKINKDTIINVVRDRDRTIAGNYHPIIDYYRLNELETLETPLEYTENREEYTADEWEAMKAERLEMIEQYHEDEPYFEPMTIGEVLAEAKEWNGIL